MDFDDLMPLPPDKATLVEMLREDAVNRYMDGDPGALAHSVALKPHDPAFVLLLDGKTSTTDAPYRDSCYICRDPEYAVMGLPLCYRCARCGGHIAADDEICDDCSWCINPHTQLPGDSLAPDGLPDAMEELDDPRYGHGDFETAEPFLVVTGTAWNGLPECFGDLEDKAAKAEGDYVEDLVEQGSWRGTVTAVEGHHAFTSFGPGGKSVSGEFFVTGCTVRVDDPGKSTGRRQGDTVHCRPEWLRVIRKR